MMPPLNANSTYAAHHNIPPSRRFDLRPVDDLPSCRRSIGTIPPGEIWDRPFVRRRHQPASDFLLACSGRQLAPPSATSRRPGKMETSRLRPISNQLRHCFCHLARPFPDHLLLRQTLHHPSPNRVASHPASSTDAHQSSAGIAPAWESAIIICSGRPGISLAHIALRDGDRRLAGDLSRPNLKMSRHITLLRIRH